MRANGKKLCAKTVKSAHIIAPASHPESNNAPLIGCQVLGNC